MNKVKANKVPAPIFKIEKIHQEGCFCQLAPQQTSEEALPKDAAEFPRDDIVDYDEEDVSQQV